MHRFALLLMLPALLQLKSANADGLTPIRLTLAGPHAVRVRVAQGSTFPCDSGDNRAILEGKFEPGQVVSLTTTDRCVCMQQTYAPFSDVDWGPSGMVCRPMICSFFGRTKRCVPSPDPTIRVTIRSERPS
jgi:hypothetical protein